MNYFSEHKEGFWGTIIFHSILLLILVWFGFFTQLPLPGEEGILVNIGDNTQGLGKEEPAPAEVIPPVQEKKEQEEATPPLPSEPQTSKPGKAAEEVMTQDMEKTAAIEAAKKKKEEKKKQREELERQKKIQEQKEKDRVERERLAEIERKKKEDADRIAREKEERHKQEIAEQKKKEEEQRKINEINSMAKNVFGSGGQGNSGSKSTSEGVTYKGGNQGSPNGTANSGNYNKGGGMGKGISYSLGGRSALALPLPYYPGNEEGVVVVQVTVDKNGIVTKAVAGVRGSTTLVPELLAAAQKAAMSAKFNVDANAPAFQQGTITYHFVLE